MRIACLGFVFDSAAQGIIRRVVPEGFELIFIPLPDSSDQAAIAESDFIFCVSAVTEDMIARAPRLRLIQKWGTGVDKIDLAAAERHGVYVAITAGANAGVVAEHTMLLMLGALRRIGVAERGMRRGEWDSASLRPSSRQLEGKTVGILGFGNIGRAVARRLLGFRTRIIYHNRQGPVGGPDGELGAYVPLEQLLAESDILTLHCPGGAANRHILNAETIGRMKPGAFVINAARGELIDEPALVAALESGHLLGAGLDTFEIEPLDASSPLRRLDNVVLTPHSAGSVLDHVAVMAAHAFANMAGFLRGVAICPADLVVDPSQPRFRPGAP